MQRFARLSLAAAAGAILAAGGAVESVLAGTEPTFPAQSVLFKMGKKTFKENQSKAGGVAIATLQSGGGELQFRLVARYSKFSQAGTGSQSQLGITIFRADDPRTATLPTTYAKGGPETGGVASQFASSVTKKVGKGAAATLVTTMSAWATNPADARPIRVDFTKWDPVTSRLYGKFSGQYPNNPASAARTPLIVKSGKFTAVVDFIGFDV